MHDRNAAEKVESGKPIKVLIAGNRTKAAFQITCYYNATFARWGLKLSGHNRKNPYSQAPFCPILIQDF
jgi:hypothetical protein